MRISAILFALPAALLRKTRRTKRDGTVVSPCDEFSEDSKKSNPEASDLELITGCLNLKNVCRVFVVPKPDDQIDDNHDEDHMVFCELKADLNEKKEL